MQPLSRILAAIFEDSAAKSYDHELLCDLKICPHITLCIKLILIIVHHVTPPRAPQKQTRNKKIPTEINYLVPQYIHGYCYSTQKNLLPYPPRRGRGNTTA